MRCSYFSKSLESLETTDQYGQVVQYGLGGAYISEMTMCGSNPVFC